MTLPLWNVLEHRSFIFTVPCGDSLINLSGNISDSIEFPGFPFIHIAPLTCIWHINAEPSYRIRVSIHDLQVWPDDEFIIGEGRNPADSSSAILFRTASIVPSEITSIGSTMYILFESGAPAFVPFPSGFSATVLQYRKKSKNMLTFKW